ncbi:hypothetical protein B0H19DRAFT_350174 [Mycena capillaripes]|nr:hypothetical protein B0H19DRAFT_350174 [Mycena capillaripes]
MSRPYLKSMPSTESHRAARSPRYDIQPKYYSNRAHQCRYPVLVHNIPKSVCWQELKDFGRLAGGHVAYCDLNRNKNGSGFIEYLFPEDAEDAIRQLNGKRLGGRIITVSAYSRTPRRRSRSRSPIRRSHQISARDEPRKCVFPAAASTYALQRSPRSQDGFPSLYYDGPALPAVLHPDLYTFSGPLNLTKLATFTTQLRKEVWYSRPLPPSTPTSPSNFRLQSP